MALKYPIMVARDDDFIAMRLPPQPLIEIRDLFWRVAVGHEIARMNKDVSFGQLQLRVLTVGIADADNAKARHGWVWFSGTFLLFCCRIYSRSSRIASSHSCMVKSSLLGTPSCQRNSVA